MIRTIASVDSDHSRFIAFQGSRADALERLPTVCPQERLEFGVNRISLISHQKRVDFLILAEMDNAHAEPRSSMMLVELRFNASSVNQIDEFLHCLQQKHDTPLH